MVRRLLLSALFGTMLSAMFNPVAAQFGTTVRREKGHFAALFTHGEEQNPRFRLVSTGDVLIGDSWGLLRSARFAVDWWTLFGEPVEDYIFRWESSGQFTVPGGPTITRAQVEKYPDLKLRFQFLAPTGLEVFVFYRLEETSGRRACTLFPKESSCYHRLARRVEAQLIGEAAGVTPMHAPGSPSWDKFLTEGIERATEVGRGLQALSQYGLAGTTPERVLSRKALFSQLFNTGLEIDLHDAVISRMRWPHAEMRAIAELYGKYERGEVDPTPSKIIADAERSAVVKRATDNGDVPWEPPEVNLRLAADSGRTGKIGYRDAAGRLVVPFTLNPGLAKPFESGFAIAGEEYGKVGVLDGRGSWVIPPRHRSIFRLSRDLFVIVSDTTDARGRRDNDISRVYHSSGRLVGSQAYGSVYTEQYVYPKLRAFYAAPRGSNKWNFVIIAPDGNHVVLSHNSFGVRDSTTVRIFGTDVVRMDELGLSNLVCNRYHAGGSAGDLKWTIYLQTVYNGSGQRIETYTEAELRGKPPRRSVNRSEADCVREYNAVVASIQARLRGEGHRLGDVKPYYF